MALLFVDIETMPLPNCGEWLEEPEARKNLVDPAKIRADREAKGRAQAAACSLDYNAGRIGVMVWQLWPLSSQVGNVRSLLNEDHEAKALAEFWVALRGHIPAGFRIRSFDLPWMIQRSRYLGVDVPRVNLGRFGNMALLDIYDYLTFDDTQGQWAMRRTLHAYCRRLGIPIPGDAIDGADVPGLLVAGDYETVAMHCCSDIDLTIAVAGRMGALEPWKRAEKPLYVPSAPTGVGVVF